MKILDGKKIAAEIREELACEVQQNTARGIRPPGLAVILAGKNPASEIYVRNKQKACEKAGILSFLYQLPEDVSQQELLALVDELNGRADIDGILLQLPLPTGLNASECLQRIDPDKDVDGFHPLNMGRLALNLPGFEPCTPAGILELLNRSDLSLAGKKAVVIGRSDIVGKPLALLLARKGVDATVTICHSATENLKQECQGADFLFVAMGKPRAITKDMLPPDCVVVDVGIHRSDQGLCGDVDADVNDCALKAITPVPGGIGPMTIAMLLRNTVKAWRKHLDLNKSQADC